jgi:SagB-type dehydrogenase family enzyme
MGRREARARPDASNWLMSTKKRSGARVDQDGIDRDLSNSTRTQLTTREPGAGGSLEDDHEFHHFSTAAWARMMVVNVRRRDSSVAVRNMKRASVFPSLSFLLLLLGGAVMCGQPEQELTTTATRSGETITLPAPVHDSPTSVEAALASRRSCREFQSTPLSLAEIGQLLWAAQGVSDERGRRTAPSAGALYPLEVYLVAAGVEGLESGVYHYSPAEHALDRMLAGDVRAALSQAALDQEALREAPATIALAAVYERTAGKYGERGPRYVHMEVGAAAENLSLQAEALSLGTVFIGAFHDERVQDVLQLPDDQHPLALLPAGHPLAAE